MNDTIIKNNNGISLIDKESEIRDYLECEIFKEGCGAQEPYGDESIILYQRLNDELAIKGANALLKLGYKVNILCESTALDSDKFKYCLVYASNEVELKEASDYMSENDKFFKVEIPTLRTQIENNIYKILNHLNIHHDKDMSDIGIEDTTIYEGLTKEWAITAEKIINDLIEIEQLKSANLEFFNYKVNVFCKPTELYSDEAQYCIAYGDNTDEMKKVNDYMSENGYTTIYNVENSKFDYNQIIKFYDKDDKLKFLYCINSGQFHNAEFEAREILNQNLNLSYATAELKGDVAAITRIGEEDKRTEINRMIYYDKFFKAVENHKLESVKKFVANGVDVNAKDKDGWTPLMVSVWHGNLDIAKLLVENGADVNAQNNDGNTALDEYDIHDEEMKALLIANGAKTGEEIENDNEESQTIHKRR